MNRWNIPSWLEREVAQRDRNCVYCGKLFCKTPPSRCDGPSWEHIINDARIITRENIAICCIGCNASKGAKPLMTWLQARYCIERGITRQSVAAVVQAVMAAQNVET